jgi:iron complex transport system permease protein
LFSALVVAFSMSLLAGSQWITPQQWFSGDLQSLIVLELRLPRVCLAVIVGAALGMSGAAMQGYLRNPLADPGLFGISSCAALGAVCSLFFGWHLREWLLPGMALIGAALGMAALAMLAGRSTSIVLFTLAGVALSSVAGAATALMISLAPTPFASSEIVTWLMGALTDRSWVEVQLALPLSLLGMGILLRAARALDALTLGAGAAASLGFDLKRLQWQLTLGIGLCVGSAVAVAGIIGFVGLVVPHVLRDWVQQRPSALLPAAALGGSLLVLCADTLVRLLPVASELRLGIAMSILGAPFFFALIWRLRRELV